MGDATGTATDNCARIINENRKTIAAFYQSNQQNPVVPAPTKAPVHPTPSPVHPTPSPVRPTPSPVHPTPSPVSTDEKDCVLQDYDCRRMGGSICDGVPMTESCMAGEKCCGNLSEYKCFYDVCNPKTQQ